MCVDSVVSLGTGVHILVVTVVTVPGCVEMAADGNAEWAAVWSPVA